MATQTALPPWLSWLSLTPFSIPGLQTTTPFPAPAGSQASYYLPQNNIGNGVQGTGQGGFGSTPATVTTAFAGTPPPNLPTPQPGPAGRGYGGATRQPVQTTPTALPPATVSNRVGSGQNPPAPLPAGSPNAGTSVSTTNPTVTSGRTIGGVDAGAPITEVSGTTHSPTALVLNGAKTSVGPDGLLYMQEGGNAYAQVIGVDAGTGESFQPHAFFTTEAATAYVLEINTAFGTQRTVEQTMTDQGYVLIGGQWVYQGTTGGSAQAGQKKRQTVTVGGGARGVGTTYVVGSQSYTTWQRRKRLEAKDEDESGKGIQNTIAGASYTVGTG